jgi:hypothetical protein
VRKIEEIPGRIADILLRAEREKISPQEAAERQARSFLAASNKGAA